MKQYLFLATAIATASLFTGCSNNEYVGDQPEAFNGTDGAIAFSMGKANTTRAEEGIGQLRANGFYVYGTKTKDGLDVVFKNYKVEYVSDNQDKTSDNSTGWEYVGKSLTVDNPTPNIGKGNAQTIKYWDYGASKYTFYAFSAKPGDVNSEDPNIPNIKVSTIENTSADPSYTVTIKEGASIGDLYFADKKEVNQDVYAGQGGTPASKAVQLTFRNLAAKVRVGFYETVPGYKIQINKMYAGMVGDEHNFRAVCPNIKASQNHTITVTYKGGDVPDKDYAVVSAKNVDAATELTLGPGVFDSELKTTSSSPTWDTNNGEYTFFWPQTNNGDPLKITVDYTLTSTDGSNEKIEVKGATATVPKEYVQWAANTAYTYIFKISDNTNGTTGGGAPEGLYPITFDAVVVDYANEGSITTVSTPSVTAKQDGTTNGYESVNDNGIVFKTGKTIDLKVMNGNADVTSSATITGGYINSYDYGKTPDQNLTGASIVTLTGDKKLEGKGDAGYWVLKVTYSNVETNVFTYVIIRVGDAEVGPANPPANP